MIPIVLFITIMISKGSCDGLATGLLHSDHWGLTPAALRPGNEIAAIKKLDR